MGGLVVRKTSLDVSDTSAMLQETESRVSDPLKRHEQGHVSDVRGRPFCRAGAHESQTYPRASAIKRVVWD